MFCFIKATENQVKKITAISKAAFDTDIFVGAHEAGGPLGYDSLSWHYRMERLGNLYVLFEDDILVAGAVLFYEKEPGILYVGRIFVDPTYHRKGYGIELMKSIEETFLDIKLIRLETPSWNKRTQAFYIKCGFKEVYQDNESIYFEKEILRIGD